ncbi:MAG: HprK-related kinase A [Alphaproteobacteria bacterium]
MKVGDLSVETFGRRLAGNGVVFRTGPFVTHLAAPLGELAAPLHCLYADFPCDDGGIADFHLRIAPTSWLRRRWRPSVRFLVDGQARFLPAPRRMALAMFEWGLNSCIFRNANQFLIFHAAVAERDGLAVVMAGEPGAGKSTLCAALVNRGWRLLSDEFALVRPQDGRLLPIARPVSLKNESIGIIRAFAPDATIGPECSDTHKGAVAHMKPPTDSVNRADDPATPAWILFPRYRAGAETRLEPVSRARAFFRIADQSFNYHILGAAGFESVSRLIETCSCHDLAYASLDQAVALLNGFAPATTPVAR